MDVLEGFKSSGGKIKSTPHDTKYFKIDSLLILNLGNTPVELTLIASSLPNLINVLIVLGDLAGNQDILANSSVEYQLLVISSIDFSAWVILLS